MKTIVMLGYLLLGSTYLFAQAEKEAAAIPADVTDALSMLYPMAKEVKWSLSQSDFEARFSQNERAVSLLFDQHGNLMMVKNRIDQTELPVTVLAKLKDSYPDWRVQQASLVNITGTASYEVELEKDGEMVNLTCRQGDIMRILSQESLK